MTLLNVERIDGVTNKWWRHLGDDGKPKITIQSTEDAEPVFRQAKRLKETPSEELRFKAADPRTLIVEVCEFHAVRWGVSRSEVFRELMQNKTDRAKSVWRLLTADADYRKLQGR